MHINSHSCSAWDRWNKGTYWKLKTKSCCNEIGESNQLEAHWYVCLFELFALFHENLVRCCCCRCRGASRWKRIKKEELTDAAIHSAEYSQQYFSIFQSFVLSYSFETTYYNYNMHDNVTLCYTYYCKFLFSFPFSPLFRCYFVSDNK